MLGALRVSFSFVDDPKNQSPKTTAPRPESPKSRAAHAHWLWKLIVISLSKSAFKPRRETPYHPFSHLIKIEQKHHKTPKTTSNALQQIMQPSSGQMGGYKRRRTDSSDNLLERHKTAFDDATQCLQAAKELSQAANELLKQMEPDFTTKPSPPPRVYHTHPSEMNYLHQLAKEQYELTRKRFESNCGHSFGSTPK